MTTDLRQAHGEMTACGHRAPHRSRQDARPERFENVGMAWAGRSCRDAAGRQGLAVEGIRF